ncbi:NHLP bacteriocin export ABC transporter permease/ATPase subunit [Pseudoduganella sp. DS3]|uniref:Cyclolysin secretion/processing ATP-binding protein CyaB n=1 Tax=Pseudoduganella guangdongensis TaxID=2692179 RepID=A0A6N9HLR6_9BURK|nr:NHLP bacteriocin export ABC transporter permease/ATPase subunit [Pseudoduganella guangdongensis]MYN04197.1 NHLP bacteriocin export ABC transporter permease/ATPase subunit [Pseudoduganella guangdongensis]
MNKRHDPSLDQQLLQRGCEGSARGLQLVGPGFPAWFIEYGRVDVFLVRTGDHGGAGARTLLFSVEAGQLLWLPDDCGHASLPLALMPAADARYRCIARDEVQALLAEPSLRAGALAQLDWLAASIASGLAPRTGAPAGLLEAGPCRADQAQEMAPAAPGLWLWPQAGALRYGGGEALPLARAVPLPPNSRLAMDAGSALAAGPIDTLAPELPCSALLEGVAVLAHHLHRSAIAQAEQADSAELERLHTKRARSSRAMSDALGSLVTLFHQQAPGMAPLEGRNLILAECKLIGQRQGIDFKPAAAPLDTRFSDPVKAIAQASGVRNRKVTLKGDWWLQDNGPLLAFNDATCIPHALLPSRGGRYTWIDPGSGEERPVTAEFAQALKPFAFVFYTGLPPQALALRDIVRFLLRSVRPDIAVVAAIALASALLGMAMPLASGYLFDSVFPAADGPGMVQVVLMLFVASLATLLLEATRALTMLRIEGKASSDLQAAVWDRVLSLPVPFFRDYSAGDLSTRINGINEIRQALSGTVIATAINSAFAALNIFLLFYYSSKLALVALGLLLLAVGVNLLIGYASAGVSRQAADAHGKVAGLVFEYLGGVAKLRITGAEARAFANWAASFGRQKWLALRAGSLANCSAVFNAAFPLLSNALLFACIGLADAKAEMARLSTGDFIAFSVAWTIFLNAALALVKTGIDLLPLAATYERTKPILAALPEVDASKPYPGALSGAIELSKVRFAYAADAPPVIEDVSLSIAPGQFVALVGSSGSGKSTLLRLMLGFEQPSNGGLYVDGQNLNEIDIGAVRRQMGVVLQSGRLMSGDIFTNIIGASNLTLEDAWAAARACGLDRDIEAMPMGMHTLVSEGGATLSGGQRQRLLIARAIVTQPKIVFFDEATSALDNQSQAIVSASLEQLKATRVVIAHRLSTIMNADCIYVLDKGKLVQSGTYQELMAQDGLFAELAKRQLA